MVHLQWDTVPNDNVNGILRGYTLKYRWKELRNQWFVTNTDKTYFDMKVMPGATSIEFKVAAKTAIGNGPYSSVTEAAMQYTGTQKCKL